MTVRFTNGDEVDSLMGEAIGNFITANTARTVFGDPQQSPYARFSREYEHPSYTRRTLDMTPIQENGRTIYVHQG